MYHLAPFQMAIIKKKKKKKKTTAGDCPAGPVAKTP